MTFRKVCDFRAKLFRSPILQAIYIFLDGKLR